jgi:GTP-binding protein Era
LNDVVDDSISDVDAIGLLLPADQKIGPGDQRILQRLQSQFEIGAKDRTTAKWRIPVFAILTKIDEISREQLTDKLIELDQFAKFTEIVPVSALKDDNLDELERVFLENIPVGPKMYPDDMLSEERPEESIAELIRGAFLEELDDELPHSLAVVVDSIERGEDDEGAEGREGESGEGSQAHAVVYVSVYVERDSQKPIIIGHRAEHLVRVKKKVRTAVNKAVGAKARIDMQVKVSKGWQSDPKKLDRLGF